MKKVILITGCHSGIGRATMLAAARQGHTVYAGLRDSADTASIEEEKGSLPIVCLQLDVTNYQDRSNAVETILQQQGQLDILVNNAGVTLGGFLEQIEDDELRHVFDVNVFGVWGMTKAVLPAMRKAGKGLIINISSSSGIIPFPGYGAYGASKFALNGMSEVWRYELSRFGINVTTLEPGAYRTDMFTRNKTMSRGTQIEESPYYKILKKMEVAFLSTTSHIAHDPAEIAQFIVKLMDKEKVRMYYPVGPSAKIRFFMRRFFPFSSIEIIIRKIFKQPKKPK